MALINHNQNTHEKHRQSLPPNLKLIETNSNELKKTIRSNAHIEKDTRLDTLYGKFSSHRDIESDPSSSALEVIDGEGNSKGWFELEKHQSWVLSLRSNENIDKCNLIAIYSSNDQVKTEIRFICS